MTPNPVLGTMALDAWLPMARHMNACGQCGPVIAELRQTPDIPAPLYDRCCPAGQVAFVAWMDARGELAEAGRPARERLGMTGLPPAAAELRARTLEAIPPEAFRRLLGAPLSERLAQIEALEAAFRRRHMLEVWPAGRSEFDDGLLYRWSCSCVAEASGDYLSAEAARRGWERHSGFMATPATIEPEPAEERRCAFEGCATGPYGSHGSFRVKARFPAQRYCCDACRKRDRDGRRPQLIGMEEE